MLPRSPQGQLPACAYSAFASLPNLLVGEIRKDQRFVSRAVALAFCGCLVYFTDSLAKCRWYRQTSKCRVWTGHAHPRSPLLLCAMKAATSVTLLGRRTRRSTPARTRAPSCPGPRCRRSRSRMCSLLPSRFSPIFLAPLALQLYYPRVFPFFPCASCAPQLLVCSWMGAHVRFACQRRLVISEELIVVLL